MNSTATPDSLELLDLTEQPLHLVGGQRRGRLVHDQHAHVLRHRLGDLDRLLLADRQRARGCRRIEGDVEPGEDLGGVALHPAPVDDSTTITMSDEDVLGDGEVGEDERFLVDRDDPLSLGVGGRRHHGRFAVDEDLTTVGMVEPGDDLDQRRLPCAVLAEQRVDLAGVQLDLRVVERQRAAEALGHLPCDEHRGAPERVRRSATSDPPSNAWSNASTFLKRFI